MKNEQIVVVHEKSESTIVKLAKIVALVAASPFILVMGIIATMAILTMFLVLIGSGIGVFQTAAPWLIATIVVCALLPAVRERVANKKKVILLQQKIHTLELELSEVRLEVLKEHESAEFHRKLNETKSGDSIKLKESVKERL